MSDKSKMRPLKLNRPQGEPVFYADYVTANTGYFGVKISFGTYSPASAPDAPEIDLCCSIGMSVEHANSLYEVLGKQLRFYEEQFGSIRTEPSLNADDRKTEAEKEDPGAREVLQPGQRVRRAFAFDD
jgi:hypothetical protein